MSVPTKTMNNAVVGIIANPAAGKDIRRLVAQGRVIPNHEKINIVRRIYAGLDSIGIDQVLFMPDPYDLCWNAFKSTPFDFKCEKISMHTYASDLDSVEASKAMVDIGVACIITLGGDGTNRSVAKGSRSTPLIAVSTGTNNVFPEMIEGTTAGQAAATIARGFIDPNEVSSRRKLIEIQPKQSSNEIDTALIDLAISNRDFIGSRALWEPESIIEIVLSQAVPGNTGISAIGAALMPTTPEEDTGLHLKLGHGGISVKAPMVPGLISTIGVQECTPIKFGEQIKCKYPSGTVALDGERTLNFKGDATLGITLTRNGPTLVNVRKALHKASLGGVFSIRNTF